MRSLASRHIAAFLGVLDKLVFTLSALVPAHNMPDKAASMANGQPGPAPPRAPGDRWLTTVAALAVGAAFFGLWFWLLPPWLGFHVETAGAAAWRWLAAIPSVLGFAVALRCVWDFGWTGRGTPVPIASPTHLVVVGFATGWIGLWIVFGHANLRAIAAVAAAALGVHLFVYFYEEPTLRKKFGGDYEDYCRNVNRWLPRFTPWTLPQ